MGPIETQAAASTSRKKNSEPWNGEFYCSFGHDINRSWSEAVKYGFVCGGGGPWYSRTLRLLNLGDRVWVNIPATGYVGVGRVIGECKSAAEFTIHIGGNSAPAMDILELPYLRQFIDDEEKCEYFVPVEWLDTKSIEEAVQEVVFFGNQNTICKPTALKWQNTVNRLKECFSGYDS